MTVPATSANLGPGFDSLGMAVDLRLSAEVREAEEDSFLYEGEGPPPSSAGNLLHRGFSAAYAAVGAAPPPVSLRVDNPIPLARGLGSSAAAVVAGVAAADEMMGGSLGREGVFRVAAELEGHPDNVGPAVFGGFVVAARRQTEGYVAASLPVPREWRLLFGVPSFELRTSAARAALPGTFSLADAAATAGRAALWVAAVARNDRSLLRTASFDVLHQPYRAALVPGLGEVLSELERNGADAAFLSGAGPTVGVVTSADSEEGLATRLRAWVGEGGRVLRLSAASGYALDRC